jgi:hypothetical protein
MVTVEVPCAFRTAGQTIVPGKFADPTIHKIPNKYVSYFRRKNAALD